MSNQVNIANIPRPQARQKAGNSLKLLGKDLRKNKWLYLIALPAVLYFLVYCYYPMYGAVIAFKNFSPAEGILGSPWVGFKYFLRFFNGVYFFRLIRNTFLLNFYDLLWGFPASIILALLLNEIRSSLLKRTVQTVTYLPHFISTVVICGMIVDFTSTSGLINNIISSFGGTRANLLMDAGLFRTIYVGTNIWQGLGWGSIIYIAALSGIDPSLYEACRIDGGGRFQQMLHISLPGIMPTIVILLILRMGSMMSIGFEKIFLLYNPAIYETSDVISTYVYREGILNASYSYSTAVGLFNSVINFALLIFANRFSRKISDTSLW